MEHPSITLYTLVDLVNIKALMSHHLEEDNDIYQHGEISVLGGEAANHNWLVVALGISHLFVFPTTLLTPLHYQQFISLSMFQIKICFHW